MRRFFFTLLLVVLPARAFALDMEYHTYNGFDPILTAFQKIALIFGHNSFRGLFFSVVVAGILFGGLALYMKAFMGNRFSLGTWLTPLAVGVVLYLGLIIPTGNLIIYDDVLNRFQAVAGVPNGIVAVAGVTNLIESVSRDQWTTFAAAVAGIFLMMVVAFRRHESPYTGYACRLREIDDGADYDVTLSYGYNRGPVTLMKGAALRSIALTVDTAPGSVLLEYCRQK